MTAGDQTPPGSGPPDPDSAPAPRAWGPTPRRWVPGDTWAGAARVSNGPAARRSALTPLPEDDDDRASAPRRSALTPLPEADEPAHAASRARRSAMSPGEDDDDFDIVVPRRSAMSPLPSDEARAAVPRRSAFTPNEPEDAPAPRRSGWVEDDDEDDGYEETLRLPLPRYSSEYAVAARAIQPALPDLGPTAESAPSPAEPYSPVEPPSPVTDATSPFSPSVQPALPDPALSGPIEAAFANTELLPVVPAAVAPPVASDQPPVTVEGEAELPAEEDEMVSEGAPVAEVSAPVVEDPAVAEPPAVFETPVPVAEPPAAVVETHVPAVQAQVPVVEAPSPLAEAPAAVVETPIPVAAPPALAVEAPLVQAPPAVTVTGATMTAAAVAAEVEALPEIVELPAAVAEDQELLVEESDMVSEGAPPVEDDASTVGEDTGTWLFGSAFADADHSLYRRPAPGEPETQVDLTPIVIDDPEYDVRKGTKPLAKSTPRPSGTRGAKPTRGTSARRVHVAWRDHKRLLTISSILLALLLVVGVGGYLLSRYNPTIAAINEGKLTLPVTAGTYQRDPSQGATPSEDPNSKIQTVSATYSVNGTQEFVAIAYRPQTDPSAALQEIQARSIMKVDGGACGKTTDQNRMACAVVSGTTAVLLVTLIDQSTDELIAAAQSVSAGIGKT